MGILVALMVVSQLSCALAGPLTCFGCFVVVCGTGTVLCARAPTFQPCAAAVCGPAAFLTCSLPCGVGGAVGDDVSASDISGNLEDPMWSTEMAVDGLHGALEHMVDLGAASLKIPVPLLEHFVLFLGDRSVYGAQMNPHGERLSKQ